MLGFQTQVVAPNVYYSLNDSLYLKSSLQHLFINLFIYRCLTTLLIRATFTRSSRTFRNSANNSSNSLLSSNIDYRRHTTARTKTCTGSPMVAKLQPTVTLLLISTIGLCPLTVPCLIPQHGIRPLYLHRCPCPQRTCGVILISRQVTRSTWLLHTILIRAMGHRRTTRR